MAIRQPGETPRWRPDLRPWLAAAATALALFAPSASFAAGDAVPLPRLNPVAAATSAATMIAEASDPIGNLISGDDAAERDATEDSDEPDGAPQDILPATPTLAPPATGADTEASAVQRRGLKAALQLLDDNDPAGATLAAAALPNRVDTKIVDWLIATSGYAAVSSSAMLTLQRSLAGWPSPIADPRALRAGAGARKPRAGEVIAALGAYPPSSDDGRLLLADAYVASGKKDAAAAIVRDLWRTRNLSPAVEKKILQEFLRPAPPSDHKARMDRLLYAERTSDALRAAKPPRQEPAGAGEGRRRWS